MFTAEIMLSKLRGGESVSGGSTRVRGHMFKQQNKTGKSADFSGCPVVFMKALGHFDP